MNAQHLVLLGTLWIPTAIASSVESEDEKVMKQLMELSMEGLGEVRATNDPPRPSSAVEPPREGNGMKGDHSG